MGKSTDIFRLFYSLKYVWKYIFMQYWSTILFRISVQHFAGIFPKHYSRDEVLLFLAPVRKIIKIFTTLVRKKYDWICSDHIILNAVGPKYPLSISIYIKMSCKNGFVRDSRPNHWTDSDERCTVRTVSMCRSVYSIRNSAQRVQTKKILTKSCFKPTKAKSPPKPRFFQHCPFFVYPMRKFRKSAVRTPE